MKTTTNKIMKTLTTNTTDFLKGKDLNVPVSNEERGELIETLIDRQEKHRRSESNYYQETGCGGREYEDNYSFWQQVQANYENVVTELDSMEIAQ